VLVSYIVIFIRSSKIVAIFLKSIIQISLNDYPCSRKKMTSLCQLNSRKYLDLLHVY
jgi:hypothetical protein